MNHPDARMEFFRQVFGGAWITQGIGVAAELGIADLLADGPRTIEALAGITGTDKGALYRLLRALAGIGIFAQDEEERFTLTALAELLRSDVPGSQRSFAIMMAGEFDGAWGELLYSVRSGKPGFDNRFGKSFFQFMEEVPERHGIYDAAMTGIHGVETGPVLDAYDFGVFQTVADIGGGQGHALAETLRRHPHMTGILFDLPAVTERTRTSLQTSDVVDRIRFEGGDFFASVPQNADAYVLRHIIHDWEDPEAMMILRQCRDAMAPDGRILVVEMVIPPANEPGFGKWLDLMMLLVGGRERTEVEYRCLFDAAGLKLTRVIPTHSDVSIIEGIRVS
jgi:SAM-dependent methyltransferase